MKIEFSLIHNGVIVEDDMDGKFEGNHGGDIDGDNDGDFEVSLAGLVFGSLVHKEKQRWH